MGNHVIRDRIWESGKLERCSDSAAAWYPWIYLVCNEHGIFEYHPRAIWMSVFRRRPSVSQADVAGWLLEYEREGLMIRYHMDGELAFWTGFKGRKPSERKENAYPDPLTFPEVTSRLQELGISEFDSRAVAATKPRRKRDKSAEVPRQNRASIELDQEQEQELDQGARAIIAAYNSSLGSDIGYTAGNLAAARRALGHGYTVAQASMAFEAVREKRTATAKWCAENNHGFEYLTRPPYKHRQTQAFTLGAIDKIHNELASLKPDIPTEGEAAKMLKQLAERNAKRG